VAPQLRDVIAVGCCGVLGALAGLACEHSLDHMDARGIFHDSLITAMTPIVLVVGAVVGGISAWIGGRRLWNRRPMVYAVGLLLVDALLVGFATYGWYGLSIGIVGALGAVLTGAIADVVAGPIGGD
jgi:hypothetical protein